MARASEGCIGVLLGVAVKIIILKLTDAEYEHLQTMSRDGWASTIEGKIYQNTFVITDDEAKAPLTSFLRIEP